MEFRPILSAMLRNKTGSILVALQIALTLAIVVNCMFMAKQKIDHINRPSGMDVGNIISVSSVGFGNDYNHDRTIEDDLRLLSDMPGIVSVSTSSGVPMSGSGSANGFAGSTEDDAPRHTANYYSVSEDIIDTLGVTLESGRTFRDIDVRRADDETLSRLSPQVIITRAIADKLFGEGDPAVGKLMYDGLGEGSEVVGVIEHMYGAWVGWSDFGQVALFPQRTEGPHTRYLIRAEAGRRDELIPVIEKTLADSNRTRLIRNVRSMEEIVKNSYEGDNAIAVTLSVAVVLLLGVTGLGIVGLASFTVRQRTKQIGTRRAIGARKRDIIRYFLIENWLMTTIGIALGTVLTIGINYSLASAFDIDQLNYAFLVAGMFMLWLLGFMAVAEPARRAAQVSPSIATRTV
ncbi:MAG: FtsX-like permease family protein [Pseudomonadota bacterium]